ncbi:MAG TPA: undecaprenyl-phosphate glucose phosphotransferase [Acidobacteriota bacterium]
MIGRQNRILLAIFLTGDVLAIGAAYLVAFWFRFHSGALPVQGYLPPLEQYLKVFPLALVLTLLALRWQGLYRFRRVQSRIDELFSLIVATGVSTVIFFGVLLYVKEHVFPIARVGADASARWSFSRPFIAAFFALAVDLLALERIGLRLLLDRARRGGRNLVQVAIAGAGETGRRLARKLVEHGEFGFRVLGFLDDDPTHRDVEVEGIKVIGRLDDLVRIHHERGLYNLYIALPVEQRARMGDLIHTANQECIQVRVVPDAQEYVTLRTTIEDLDGLPIMSIESTPLEGLGGALKRGVDLLGALVGLALTALLLPLVALGIKLSSPGPVFYRQQRMGLDGRRFRIVKFRSMVADAEARTGPVWAHQDDPRRTAFGRLLRRLSLDELPQFWNVLRGEMSLVGPRPERPEFVAEFKQTLPKYMLRHKVKSGLTGWAQVSGLRGNTSLQKRIEYDLYYIENWSLAFDFKIMLLTLWRFLFHRHAY